MQHGNKCEQLTLILQKAGGMLLFLALWLHAVGGGSGCPAMCVCYNEPRPTAACQQRGLPSVPTAIPPHIQRIFLQSNRLTALHSTIFSHCANLTVLWLYSNNLSHIAANAFAGLQRLEELDLADNSALHTVSATAFRGLERLHTLHLHRCGLSELPDGVFRGLRSLQYLYLQDNYLQALHDHIFQDQANLSYLFLHNNRIATVSDNSLRGLLALDRLLLHQNRVSTVQHGAFQDLGRLTTLYLFQNNLTELSGVTMAPLGSLQYLRLNGNPWVCDCRAHGLWDWFHGFHEFRGFQGSSTELECQVPESLAGRDLKLLKREDLEGCHAQGGALSGAWPAAETPPRCCLQDKSSIVSSRGRLVTHSPHEKGDMSGPRFQEPGRLENGTRSKHKQPGGPRPNAHGPLEPTEPSGQRGRCLKGRAPDGQCAQGGASPGRPLGPLLLLLSGLWHALSGC
ncbi:hypothetical protein AAFF_G00054490 [Aldrovandia affinis]|uniref:LRRCT domain-containing protein n=1 Tax=Aldrovandia affinis TaxID=143900 RepID=A0AAD7S0S8_9TELE|nr:hypothetical protein AAFF_G00054490 [Aldrovandia affinis]